VRVWDVREKVQLCEFAGHKFSIECVRFSTNPATSLLVSIGSIHDAVVNVWHIKSRLKVASNKITCKVRGLAFSLDGAYFVTVGVRHVKFWYLTTSSHLEPVPIKGRAAILGDHKNNSFCDVACGSEDGWTSMYTYALTTNGTLCQFDQNRCLYNTTDLRSERAYCIHAENGSLFAGCSNGNIHIFKQANLEFISSLPLPHYLGVDVLKGLDVSHVFESSQQRNQNKDEFTYPDCIAVAYNKYTNVISAVYNDHSFYVWDINDMSKVKKLDSHLFHSSCCWSLDIYMPGSSSMITDNVLPVNSFITCSTDNTLRIWNLPHLSDSAEDVAFGNRAGKIKSNIYSKELLKIIYIDNDISALCEADQWPATENELLQQQQQQPVPLKESSNNPSNVESKMGARCLKINPLGTHLATGDRNGNIRIYDLTTLQSICLLEAHEGEILYLHYSQPTEPSGRVFLASSSRDRLIHIFDATTGTYDLMQTLDDHSAAINSVRFCSTSENQLCVVSCGADKSIMFRTATPGSVETGQAQFARTSYVAEKQTFYDLGVDSAKSVVYTIAQDRMVRVYGVKDGKRVKQFRGSLSEDGYLLKMDINKNGK
jgi:WD40 repeat protein